MDMYAALKDLTVRVQALEVATPEGEAPQLEQAHESITSLEARQEDTDDALEELRTRFRQLDARLDAHMANLDGIAEKLEALFAGPEEAEAWDEDDIDPAEEL